MSGNEADFTLKLIDKVSGASMRIKGNMGQLSSALAQVGSGSKAANGMLARMTGGIDKTGGAADKAGSSMMSFIGGNLIAAAVETAAHAFLELSAEIVKTGYELTVFGQNSELAFNQLAKHGVAGTKLFEHARDLAVRFGLDVQDTTHAYEKFLALQFNPKQIDDLVKMGADLRVLGANAEDVQGVFLGLSQIKSIGSLQGRQLLMLEQRGISGKLIREDLASQLGKSVDEVNAMMHKGKISADMGITAIQNALKKKLQEKNLGDAGAKFADNTIEGITGRFKALATDAGVSMVDKLTAPITQKLSKGVVKFQAFLDSKEGQETIDKIATGIEKAANFAMELADAFGEGFSTTFSALYEGAKPFFALFEGGDGATATTVLKSIAVHLGEAAALALGFGVAMGVVAAGLAVAGDAILTGAGAAIDWVGEKLFKLIDAWDNIGAKLDAMGPTLGDKAYGIGKAIVDGMGNAITALARYPIDALENLATSALNALKNTFQTHSPSRATYAIGGDVAAGLTNATNDNRGAVAAASTSLAEAHLAAMNSAFSKQPAWTSWDMPRAESDAFSAYGDKTSAASAREAMDSGAQASAGRGGAYKFNLTVQVDGSGAKDAQELGGIVGTSVRREIDDYMRTLTLET